MNFRKPQIRQIEQLDLSAVNHYSLDNGIPVYELNYPQSAEVVKLELLFKAGRLYESNSLVSKVTAALVKEGSKRYSSKDIANKLDFYGAYMHAQSSMDYSAINVLCLNKHFSEILDLISDTVYNPLFSIDEFEKYKQRAIEDLKLQLSKNDVLGYRELTEKLFGSHHPYGYNSVEADYDSLKLEEVVAHYRSCYTPDNCILFVSGNITSQLRAEINNCVGKVVMPPKQLELNDLSLPELPEKPIFVKGKQSLQKSIYIGARLFNRSHKDYFGMVLLNTLLGGYFSSRLNMRIREKEALSYGVDAQLDIMREDGFFYISTEVENDNEVATKRAIYEELKRLREELVSPVEIANTVRYIKGTILSSLDGPFKQVKVLQSLILNDIPAEMFSRRLEALDLITPEDLMRLANIYYNEKNLVEVVVKG